MRRLVLAVAFAAAVVPSLPLLAQDAPSQPQEERPGARPGGPRGPGGPGMGMGGFGGPQLSAEASKAAWEAEAKGVASSLGLDAEKTAAVVSAYTAARESHNRALEAMRKKMMDEGDEPDRERFAEMREAMDKMNRTERGKLERALTDAIDTEPAKKAMESLGTFSRLWDGMVDAVLGFKLEEAKQAEALKAIQNYVAATGKARAAGPDADRDAMRLALMEARDTLTSALKPILSEEQMAKIEPMMGRGGGGGRGGRGGGNT